MIPGDFDYHRATSTEEAVRLLADNDDAKLPAGGHSLLPMMKLRLAVPTVLVDIGGIEELSFARQDNGDLVIGSMTTHADIAASEIVAAGHGALAEAAASIGDVQVRNLGTIGGSVAEADPSGDWTPVLLTLGAQVVCQGPKESRTVPLADFIQDAYANALKPGELIREIRAEIPPKGSGGAYLAFKRSAQVYATASAAVQLTMKGDTCEDVQIVLQSAQRCFQPFSGGGLFIEPHA